MAKRKYEEEEESEFLHHVECKTCGSSDANGVYSDGHEYCFGCDTWLPPSDKVKKEIKMEDEGFKPSKKMGFIEGGSCKELKKRGITGSTVRKWSYEVGKDFNGKSVQLANYYDESQNLVTQKVRYANKDFMILGDNKGPLYGQWLWTAKVHGKQLIIVEGEIDALSVSQAYNHRKPVVSITKGVKGAKKDLQRNLEFIQQFDEIILAFDNDEHGRKGMDECAPLFKAGQVKICTWIGAKDANDLLVGNDLININQSIKEAKPWRPDGIVNGMDVSMDELQEPMPHGMAYPYPLLQSMTFGSRGGELIIWTAGSGIGKSTILREIAYHFVNVQDSEVKVGMIFLEESMKKTAQAFIALDNDVPLAKLRHDPAILTEMQWSESKGKLFDSGKVFFYKHFGSLDSEILLEKIRYMVVGLGVTHIFLDHISIAISGNDSDNERKDIDMLMTEMRSLVEETSCHIDAIVHLKRTSGKASFNEGGQVSLTDLRGSASLEQLSDAVIALERNQQANDEDEDANKDVSQIRLLKNREIGIVGPADRLKYDHETGRLLTAEDSDNEFFVPTSKANVSPEKEVNNDF